MEIENNGCPICGYEMNLEEDIDEEGELIAQDLVCPNCGYTEVLF